MPPASSGSSLSLPVDARSHSGTQDASSGSGEDETKEESSSSGEEMVCQRQDSLMETVRQRISHLHRFKSLAGVGGSPYTVTTRSRANTSTTIDVSPNSLDEDAGEDETDSDSSAEVAHPKKVVRAPFWAEFSMSFRWWVTIPVTLAIATSCVGGGLPLLMICDELKRIGQGYVETSGAKQRAMLDVEVADEKRSAYTRILMDLENALQLRVLSPARTEVSALWSMMRALRSVQPDWDGKAPAQRRLIRYHAWAYLRALKKGMLKGSLYTTSNGLEVIYQDNEANPANSSFLALGEFVKEHWQLPKVWESDNSTGRRLHLADT
ncbi:unnamed protein product [Polarella glacialis]|uniref:Uncharacterized protein n=1 Tax=Polarella glacialis TaxID=89957 RepID=A0A813FSF8_POLGL|nr:unnamed protein product [Polarella glacialis]